jgi:opacity protein-like surface antigen
MRHLTIFAILASLLMLSTSALAVRAVIQPTVGVANGQESAGWYAIGTAGHYFNASIDGKQILIVNTSTITTTDGINLTVIAGEYWREALGDALFQLPANATYILGPFESSRFKQFNETVLIDSNATRGSVALVLLP